jgi:diaminopimelate epimerase
MPLTYTTFYSPYATQFVLFDSIGYEVGLTEAEAKRRQDQLPKRCKEFNLPAFGFIAVKQDTIKPLIYVRETDSTVWETACGSGSVAWYITQSTGIVERTDRLEIKQPTGKAISVRRMSGGKKPFFAISAEVEKVSEN